MNYLQVIEILRKMEKDTRIIQIEERLVHCKRDLIKYKKDTIPTNLEG